MGEKERGVGGGVFEREPGRVCGDCLGLARDGELFKGKVEEVGGGVAERDPRPRPQPGFVQQVRILGL